MMCIRLLLELTDCEQWPYHVWLGVCHATSCRVTHHAIDLAGMLLSLVHTPQVCTQSVPVMLRHLIRNM